MTLLPALLLSCARFDAGPEPAVAPPEPALRRLTIRQYHNAVADLFGADLLAPTSLEPDATLEGLPSLGAAIASTSPLGVERYEAGARLVADQVFADAAPSELPCSPSGPSDAACARAWLEARGPAVLRRPLTPAELDTWVGLVTSIGSDAGDFRVGARYALAGLLQSPAFLYRSEHNDGQGGPLEAFELATRLSFFLWNGPPDEALLAAASEGRLGTPEGRASEVDRMMEHPRFRRGVRDFFTELLGLDGLNRMTKDPTVFAHTSPELWASAREQTLGTIEQYVVDEDADYRALFTSRRAWVDARLAALYAIPAPALQGFAWAELPADGGRAGLLGHASLLALHAHATSSSATRRGKFVRATLLCQGVPPPPADVDTSIPEADASAPTLRDRLQSHQENPTCAACHRILDPVGLALENFDGVGRWREIENGVRIDPSGELDGASYSDAIGLGEAVAAHEQLGHCLTERLVSYGVGHLPTDGEEAWVEWLAHDFEGNGMSVRHLIRAIALSDAFAVGGDL